jgi:hypothetical protein
MLTTAGLGPPLSFLGRRDLPAGQRPRRAGGAGEAEWQPTGHAGSEEGKALRLQRVSIPTDGLDRVDRHAEPIPQRGHDCRVAPSAAGDQPSVR